MAFLGLILILMLIYRPLGDTDFPKFLNFVSASVSKV